MPLLRFYPHIPRCLALTFLAGLTAVVFAAPASLSKGDLVRLTRGEELQFQGKKLIDAAKGHEFTVLQQVQGLAYVGYVKDDGTLVAASVPADALEPLPRDGWQDLLQGMEAFRDQRFEESKRLLLRAAQDEKYRSIATPLSTRIGGALVAPKSGFPAALQGLRETAEQLSKLGYPSLALALEEGADRLAARVLGGAPPASKMDRAELTARATAAGRATMRARQSIAAHRMLEASKRIEEGLAAEPARPDLKELQARCERDIKEADDRHKAANSMRQHGPKGTIHALTALEMGLKRCADHPKLLALKKEMQGAFEERTAPPVTPALLAVAGSSASAQKLEEGRKLYTTRCTECHDLELLDSRAMSGWRTVVAGMARRAGVNEAQQAQILEYIAIAQNSLDAK
jgi:hypothetical protein